MPINTKKVQGRRIVRYESYGELFADAQRFSGAEVRTLGNWSQGQIFEHIARSMDAAIDGAGFSMPAPARWIMSLLMKRKFLTKTISAGFKSTDRFIPGETSAEEGLASLEKAIARQQQETKRAMHPGFGKMSAAEHDLFNLRHAEVHMSFLVVDESVAT